MRQATIWNQRHWGCKFVNIARNLIVSNHLTFMFGWYLNLAGILSRDKYCWHNDQLYRPTNLSEFANRVANHLLLSLIVCITHRLGQCLNFNCGEYSLKQYFIHFGPKITANWRVNSYANCSFQVLMKTRKLVKGFWFFRINIPHSVK